MVIFETYYKDLLRMTWQQIFVLSIILFSLPLFSSTYEDLIYSQVIFKT